MSFSNEWDETYQKNTHISIWPWSDLVSYVMRYAQPRNPLICNVLELGCGAGANIEFFKWLGVNYYGIEGSSTIVKMLKDKFPDFASNIIVSDFTNEIPFDAFFDIVVDRASLTHNDTESIRRSLSIILKKMKPGASFIGIDWFSTNHSDFLKNIPGEDGFTHSSFINGQFAGVGKVHFSDKNHIINLFDGFDIKMLEEKRIYKEIPSDSHIFASWNIHAIKK